MYLPESDLIWTSVFAFPEGQGESVAWHRYASSPDGIRAIGCEMEADKRQRKPEATYAGHVQASAAAIRAVKSPNGNGFNVVHLPDVDGADVPHHAEVRYDLVAGTTYQELKRGERNDLKFSLQKAFSALQAQACG